MPSTNIMDKRIPLLLIVASDILTSDEGPDAFSCGSGIDTITDFNADEGDTKTADCENF